MNLYDAIKGKNIMKYLIQSKDRPKTLSPRSKN